MAKFVKVGEYFVNPDHVVCIRPDQVGTCSMVLSAVNEKGSVCIEADFKPEDLALLLSRS